MGGVGPRLTDGYVQELLTLGPFLGIDATTAPYYVDPNHAVDATNVVPNRAYQGYVTVQGRVSLGVTAIPADPVALIKALDATSIYYLGFYGGAIYFFRASSAATTLTLPSGASLTTGGNFTQAGNWTFFCTTGQNDTPIKVRYDTHAVTNWGIVAPTTAPTVASGGGGALNFPAYQYRVTFGVQSGGVTSQESSPGPASTAISLVSSSASLTAIPVSTDAQVNQRNIYRLDSGGQYRVVGTLNDNTTTTFSDNTADAAVTGQNLIINRDPPKNFYALEYHKDCLFGFGYTSTLGPQTQSDIWWSNPTEPWGFNAALQTLPVGENFGNDIAVGLASTSGVLLCFKTKTTYILFGDSSNNFLVQKAFDIGCIAARSITKTQGVTYWLSAEGVYSFDGSTPQYLSARIKSFLNTNKSVLSTAVGFYYDHAYYLSFPTLAVTWMYDTTTQEWWKIGWATAVAYYDPNNDASSVGEVIGSAVGTGNIVTWFDAETDLGSAITSTYTSRIADSGTPEATKQYRKLIILSPPQTGAKADVTITADPGLTQKSASRVVDLGTGAQAKIVSIPPNIKGREVQVSISVTSSQQVQIQKISLYGWIERRLAPGN